MIAPLHVASKYGNLNIVTLLVEKGSKVDIPNKVCFVIHWRDLSLQNFTVVVVLLLHHLQPFIVKII